MPAEPAVRQRKPRQECEECVRCRQRESKADAGEDGARPGVAGVHFYKEGKTQEQKEERRCVSSQFYGFHPVHGHEREHDCCNPGDARIEKSPYTPPPRHQGRRQKAGTHRRPSGHVLPADEAMEWP